MFITRSLKNKINTGRSRRKENGKRDGNPRLMNTILLGKEAIVLSLLARKMMENCYPLNEATQRKLRMVHLAMGR